MTRVAAILALALAASDAAAQTFVIDTATCRALVAHQPSADVSYKPGADVKGRPVAGADLQPETPPVLAKEFTFDINVDLRGRVPIGSPLQEPQLNVGRVALAPDGRLAFNGRPLADPERAAIAELCQRRAR